MVKSGSDTAASFPVEPRRIERGGRTRHRSEPLKQGPRKSACGMSARIEEGAGKGKGAATPRGARESVTPSRRFKALGAENCPASRRAKRRRAVRAAPDRLSKSR